MRLVNDYGQIVRMTEKNYRKWLEAGAIGHIRPACNYGNAVGHLSFTATNQTMEGFKSQLETENWLDNQIDPKPEDLL